MVPNELSSVLRAITSTRAYNEKYWVECLPTTIGGMKVTKAQYPGVAMIEFAGMRVKIRDDFPNTVFVASGSGNYLFRGSFDPVTGVLESIEYATEAFLQCAK